MTAGVCWFSLKSTMPRYGANPFSFPEFRGCTRAIIVANLAAYFVLLVVSLLAPLSTLPGRLMLTPLLTFSGDWWQPFTYSFVHPTLMGTLVELLSVWFLAGFLENTRTAQWVGGLYAASALGTAMAGLVIGLAGHRFGWHEASLYGANGAIFGLLVAIGLLFGNTEFLLFFTIGIKARHMVSIYALISLAMLFGEQRAYAFAQLGGAVGGWLFVALAPRRGVSFSLSERWYSLRNSYYRWKRRRAARKFEVYMRRQGRTVHLDGSGRPIDDESTDRSRWN